MESKSTFLCRGLVLVEGLEVVEKEGKGTFFLLLQEQVDSGSSCKNGAEQPPSCTPSGMWASNPSRKIIERVWPHGDAACASATSQYNGCWPPYLHGCVESTEEGLSSFLSLAATVSSPCQITQTKRVVEKRSGWCCLPYKDMLA